MHDERRYPTLRFLKCSSCGNVFVAGLDGKSECPDCASQDTTMFSPGEDQPGADTGATAS
ncbi:MAG: hypothetical protein GF398_18525 [Chitinivibrionales bacterium]|nr:hypothetical protein [Chitinivibrionales bacterium]